MSPTNDSVELDSFLVDSGLRRTDEIARKQHPTLTAQKRDYAIGIGFIIIITLLWTLGNFVLQDLYGSGYDKPFMVSYMNNSTHSLCLILILIRYWWRRNKKERMASQYYSLVADGDNDISDNPTTFQSEHLPLTTRETARLACIFCCIGFIGSWAGNASLGFTTVASSTIISSIGAFFTLIIGRIFRVEKLGLVKVGAVIMSFIGVLLVSLSDSTFQSPATSEQSRLSLEAIRSRAMFGDALALISALFGAICVIFLKVRIKEESRIDTLLFYGLVGLFNLLLLWPIGLILHLTGAEIFGLPRSKQDIYAILTNMAITVLNDYLCIFAMLKTTPLVFTVGLSLTIPFAVVTEFWRKTAVHAAVIVGAIVVIASFVIIGLDNSGKRPDENKNEMEMVAARDL